MEKGRPTGRYWTPIELRQRGADEERRTVFYGFYIDHPDHRRMIED